MKVTYVHVEGTAEEIARSHHLFSGVATERPQDTSMSSEKLSREPGRLTEDFVLEVFTRRPLFKNVRAAFRALLKAGPKGMTSSELSKEMGIDRGQLAGVFGAFGRRVTQTRGWKKGMSFVEESRDENNVRRYTLPDAVRSVLKSGKVDL